MLALAAARCGQPLTFTLGLRQHVMSLSSYISLRQSASFIVVVVLIVGPLTFFCDSRASFGDWSLIKLLSVAGVGGSIAFALWVEAKERYLALIPGFLAGRALLPRMFCY